jgi:Ca2+-binding EF-hand superfamily protein
VGVRSIHDPTPLGIDDIDLSVSRKGLRLTLTIPAITEPLTPEDVAYWQEQVYFFDQSRLMLRDLKDLTRALRSLPKSAQTPEITALIERMKNMDTEVQP